MALIILLVSALFALAAIIGVIDLFVHAAGWTARLLRVADTPNRTPAHRPAHGITA